MEKPDKSQEEEVLIQCIISLTSHPHYSHNTAKEIYERQVGLAQGLFDNQRRAGTVEVVREN